MLVYYPLNFFSRARLDYLNSGVALLLELCNPYLTVFANLTMSSTSTNLPINVCQLAIIRGVLHPKV